MILTQYYLDCLSQASYLVGDESTGRAVVVDPRRDVHEYVTDAQDAGLTIERVIETHVHADFVSGHLELAARTGAVISYGDAATVEFGIEPLADGQRLSLGTVELEILATPGHTPESISIVVRERPGATPSAVLTGDTLFIGDVGRPDLLAATGITPEEMAGQLYRSLHERLLTLPDDTAVLPAHGAGSACGKQLSTETRSTIGEQRRTNYALAPMTEPEFVAMVTEGQPLVPDYFAYDARRNRELRPLLAEDEAPAELTIDEVLGHVAEGAVVVDSREPSEFARAHLRGSISVRLTGRFAELTGDVVDPDRDVVLVCEPGSEVEARVRLSRIGFDRVVGALVEPERALAERPDLVARLSRLSVAELERRRDVDDLVVLDVRGPAEQADGMIPGALPTPLPRLREAMTELDPHAPTVVYCAGGTRSVLAASVLAAAGFADVSDVLGGYDAYTRAKDAA